MNFVLFPWLTIAVCCICTSYAQEKRLSYLDLPSKNNLFDSEKHFYQEALETSESNCGVHDGKPKIIKQNIKFQDSAENCSKACEAETQCLLWEYNKKSMKCKISVFKKANGGKNSSFGIKNCNSPTSMTPTTCPPPVTCPPKVTCPPPDPTVNTPTVTTTTVTNTTVTTPTATTPTVTTTTVNTPTVTTTTVTTPTVTTPTTTTPTPTVTETPVTNTTVTNTTVTTPTATAPTVTTTTVTPPTVTTPTVTTTTVTNTTVTTPTATTPTVTTTTVTPPTVTTPTVTTTTVTTPTTTTPTPTVTETPVTNTTVTTPTATTPTVTTTTVTPPTVTTSTVTTTTVTTPIGEPTVTTNTTVTNTTVTTPPSQDDCTKVKCPAISCSNCTACKVGWSSYNGTGFCYKVFAETFPDQYHAKAKCESEGAELATIHSSHELNFVKDLLAKSSVEWQAWIAGTDADSEGSWKWSNECPVIFFDWAPGEPNNHNDEHCLVLWKDYGWNMNDYYCWKDGVNAVCKTTD